MLDFIAAYRTDIVGPNVLGTDISDTTHEMKREDT